VKEAPVGRAETSGVVGPKRVGNFTIERATEYLLWESGAPWAPRGIGLQLFSKKLVLQKGGSDDITRHPRNSHDKILLYR